MNNPRKSVCKPWLHNSGLVCLLAISQGAGHARKLSFPAVKEATGIEAAVVEQVAAQKMMTRALADGAVPVIVKLRTESFSAVNLESTQADRVRRSIAAAAQDRLLKELTPFPIEGIIRFPYIPYMALTVNAAALEYLMHSDQVEQIDEDRLSSVQEAESVPLVGAPKMWNIGYTGTGVAVAVLDTGVDNTHPFLAGRVVSEACYSHNTPADGATSLCPGMASSSTDPGSGADCSVHLMPSSCEHGTKVAGVITGTGPQFSGVAKNAGIISIMVMSRVDNASKCGGAATCLVTYSSDQISALQRVYDLRNTFRIASVNMSLSDNNNQHATACDLDPRKAAIDLLRGVGIATVIATGNNGDTGSISGPACISTAISVGASGDGTPSPPAPGPVPVDVERPFSNDATFQTFMAPGSFITGPVPTWYDASGYVSGAGTSVAAPHVAGAWALLKQARPNATVQQIQDALVNTGVPVTIRAGGTKPRIAVYDAAVALGITNMVYLPLIIKN